MLLWLAFAFLTAVVLVAVLAPLARAPRREAEDASLAVYRHQLDEIDADRARGVVDEAEAAAARIEVSRRLLAGAAPEDRHAKKRSQALPRREPLAMAIALLTPVLALALYLTHGSPGMPSNPVAARAAAPLEQAQVGDLVAKVEARLREHPEDGQGWDVVAPVYMKLGRFRDAATAFANAARIEGETARRLAGFAEATVLAADGVVGEEARLAYEKILKLEPGRPEPRFWLALAKEQDGKLADALADYRALLAKAPGEAPWRSAVEDRVAEVSRRLEGASSPEPARGPTSADVAAAERLAPEDRSRMIAAMVDGLAERLQRDGRDLAGWLRLVNAYVVLERKDDARAALAKARQHFPGDEQALAKLSALAASLGLGS